MVNKIKKTIGYFFSLAAVVLIIVNNFFVFKVPGETYGRDWLGFTIYEPSAQVMFLPYLGPLINWFRQLFSLHGFVGSLTVGICGAIGFVLLKDRSQ